MLEREADTRKLLEHQLAWPAALRAAPGRRGAYHSDEGLGTGRDGGGGGGGARADQALRARIRELNRYDEALYRAANEILDERVAQLAREARDPG